MNYKIIVDSGCDLTLSMQNNLNADIVPLSINIDDRSFFDDKKLNIKHLIELMKQSKNAPKTACPSPGDFIKFIKNTKESFIVTISSKISGAYNSALVAKDIIKQEFPDKTVHVFDSRSASAGEVLVALKINEFIKNKCSFDTIISNVESFIKDMKTFFVIESLDTLTKSGRLSKLSGYVAQILSFRPIMGSDGEGNIKFFEKVRGTKQALTRLVEMISEHCDNLNERIMVISHCNNLEHAEFIRQKILEKYKNHSFKDIHIVEMAGVSSVYANSGGIVIAY